MFYIRTADRLQRTAGWLNNLEGGIDYLREVIVDDKLGIGAELEAEMAHVVGTYQCEWKDALEDPQKLAQFRGFVNSPAADPEPGVHPRARAAAPRPPPRKARAAGPPGGSAARGQEGGGMSVARPRRRADRARARRHLDRRRARWTTSRPPAASRR